MAYSTLKPRRHSHNRASQTRRGGSASREAIVDNAALVATRRKLGQAALKWLRTLADTDPQRFSRLRVTDNELGLRSAAARDAAGENLELAEVVLPMLTVQTTAGQCA